jgi:hypothetical protein
MEITFLHRMKNKLNNKMRYIVALFMIVFLSAESALAQESIIQGQRIPRLTTEERNQIPTGVNDRTAGQIIFNSDINCLEFFDGEIWRDFCGNTRWFYMPSVVIDVSKCTKEGQIDLYQEYLRQFANISGNKIIRSEGAPDPPFARVFERDELHFYVIGFDETVFPPKSISINREGVLRFEVISTKVSDATYMNIVFVIK